MLSFYNALIEDIKEEYFSKYSIPDNYLEKILAIDAQNTCKGGKIPEESSLVNLAIKRNDSIEITKTDSTIDFMRSVRNASHKDIMFMCILVKEAHSDYITHITIDNIHEENKDLIYSAILEEINYRNMASPIILYYVKSYKGVTHVFDIIDLREKVEKYEQKQSEHMEESKESCPSYNGLRSYIYYSIIGKMKGYYTGRVNVYALSRAVNNIVMQVAPLIESDPIVDTEVCKLEEVTLLDYSAGVYYAESVLSDCKDIEKNNLLEEHEIEELFKNIYFSGSGPILYQFSKSESTLVIKISTIIHAN